MAATDIRISLYPGGFRTGNGCFKNEGGTVTFNNILMSSTLGTIIHLILISTRYTYSLFKTLTHSTFIRGLYILREIQIIAEPKDNGRIHKHVNLCVK